MDIKTFLMHKKISREDLAQMVGIKPSYLNHLITGQRKASVKLIVRFVQVSEGLISPKDLRPELGGGEES